MSATATGYLASKPRYEILDGLRGVAAMIVVAFHLLETYSKGPAYQVLNHGYLAVDFFFVLSPSAAVMVKVFPSPSSAPKS